MGIKNAALVAGAGALLGGKIYLFHKYRQWKKRRALENQPGYNNRRFFAKLPRRKQREIIYRKREALRDLESISYGAGYQPYQRRRKA